MTSYGRQGLPCTAPCYDVRLWITFQRGSGVTQAVSREQVVFTTRAALVAGQELTGRLIFPPGSAHSNELIYFAEVTEVQAVGGPKKTFRVIATFRRVGLL